MGAIGHREFLALLAAEFPEINGEIAEGRSGLLHLQVAAFREATERAMDAGQFWAAEKHFRFVDRVRREATPEVENALSVSYLEDLALGHCTPHRYRAVKERMPSGMRAEMAALHANWQ